jgi:hypothetical protein
MKKLPILLFASFFLFISSIIFARSAAQSVTEQPSAVFSLEHRGMGQIDSSDAAVLQKNQKKVAEAAEIYGYDMNSSSWGLEQVVCPLIPDYLLMRYSSKNPAGAESLFTALIPRKRGRIRIVPVLNNGTTRFKPAPLDPRNFRLFSEVVPADIAKENSAPDGKWLTLSVCYAEMTGSRLRVPRNPSDDVHMVKAPPPTLRIGISGKDHEASFIEPLSKTDYRLWSITYNDAGRIVDVSDNQHSFGEPVVLHPAVQAPKQTPTPPVPQAKPMPH